MITIEPEILESLYWGNRYSTCHIANIFGCSDEVIRKRMIKYSIPRRSNVIIEPEIVESLYWGNGYTLWEIGDIFGCSGDTIRRMMIEYGFPCHNSGHIVTDFIFNDRQKEIFEGCMLGDGSLSWATNYCGFRNGDNHKEYLIWLQKLLGIKDISKITPRYHFVGSPYPFAYALTTRVIPAIRDEHKRWYPYKTRKGTFQNHNNKVIPKDIEITLIKMLFWYIGDGTYVKRVCAAHFTNYLVFDDWMPLLKKISKVLDVNSGISINKQSKGKDGIQRYKLCLNKPITHKFFDMVDSLGFDIPECYQYKFGR